MAAGTPAGPTNFGDDIVERLGCLEPGECQHYRCWHYSHHRDYPAVSETKSVKTDGGPAEPTSLNAPALLSATSLSRQPSLGGD